MQMKLIVVVVVDIIICQVDVLMTKTLKSVLNCS